MKMTRRRFLGTTIATAALAACGSDGGSGGDAGTPDSGTANKSCTTNGTNVTIGANHGHTLTVSAADVTAGVEKTYDIQGSSPHAHSVTVTAANFATLQSNPNATLALTSTSGGGHTHEITILCA